jgi:hypothetical protein
MSNFVTLKGEFHWCKPNAPEKSPFTPKGDPEKWAWKTMFIPDQESLMKVMDLQSMGVKNKLSKLEDRPGYSVNFSRPTKIGKAGKELDPPKMYQADGVTPLTEQVGNGSKGEITLELYEHKTPNGGKAHAARWYSAKIEEMVEYKGRTENEAAPSF